jgi:CRISPR-associated protein Csd1
MSWMQRLYQTYEEALQLDLPAEQQLMPISHTVQNAHINIVIDQDGNFRRAKVLKKTQIMLPATESSAGRSSGEAPHPLADKLQYVAKDYASFGGQKNAYFAGYQHQLSEWCASEFSHPQAQSVLDYVSKGNVIQDLIQANIVHVDSEGKLLNRWNDETKTAPDLFGVLPKEAGRLDQGSALICWTVERNDSYLNADTWTDSTLQQKWIDYEASRAAAKGLCLVSGVETPLATNHPAKIRHSGDKAKLISANDSSGFTFRGKFFESEQASGIGFEVTQKAHNALRWLINRQSVRNGDQAIVTWAISGKPVPEPIGDPFDFDDEDEDLSPVDDATLQSLTTFNHTPDLSSDLGRRVTEKIKRKLKGYYQSLGDTEQLSIMAIDSATPGRMAVTYYQEQLSKDYFKSLDDWYENFSWYQRYNKEIKVEGKKPKTQLTWPIVPPPPYSIAQAAYGDVLKSQDTLKKQLYSRLLPCIAEGKPFPKDIVDLCVARASNPNSSEHWEWERNVGVACALYRGFFSRHPDENKRRKFDMALDESNHNRDYLYGRLLAVAERLEEIALLVAGEKRATTAERFMQQFSERPFSTWRNIELALAPYKRRLQNNRTGFLVNRESEITEITNLFDSHAYCDDSKLTGEFLLGYHAQKMSYRQAKNAEDNTEQSLSNNSN